MNVLVGVLRLLADYSAKYLQYQCVDSQAILEMTGSILQKAVAHFRTLSSNATGAVCDVSMAIIAICTHIIASVQDADLIGITVRAGCFVQL